MISETRQQLLRVLDELNAQCPDVRFGQLIANLATLAKGPTVEAIWETEDAELLQAARQQLEIFRARPTAMVS
jgi:hypothetical protein